MTKKIKRAQESCLGREKGKTKEEIVEIFANSSSLHRETLGRQLFPKPRSYEFQHQRARIDQKDSASNPYMTSGFIHT